MFWDKVYDKLKNQYKEFEMIFVIKNSNPELADIEALAKERTSVKCFCFEDNVSENFMINSGIKQVKGEALVLCRDYFEYAPVLSNFLTTMGTQGAQVAMFKKQKKDNKISAFFSKMYHKIISSIFGFDCYEGDIGLIFFGNIALSTLKSVPHSAILTKVNRWKGFDICYAVSVDMQKPKLEKKEQKRTLVNLIISTGIMAVLTTTMSLLISNKLIGFLPILLFSGLIFLMLVWIIYGLLKYSIVAKVGDLK